MKRTRSFFALIIALTAFSLVGVNAQNYSGSNVAKGNLLEKKIFKGILALPNYSVFDHIAFQVNGGTVTLTGKVYSGSTKGQAVRLVKDLPGVTDVINHIEDLPPSPMDDAIRREALRTFADRGLSRYLWENRPDVRLIVDGGHITLEGYVSNKGDSNAFNIYANGIFGVFSVTNNLIVGNENYR